MSCILITEATEYLEEILEMLDFQGLDEFMNRHLKGKMNMAELVKQMITDGAGGWNWADCLELFHETIWYEISVVKPLFIKMLVFSILFSVIHRLLLNQKNYISQMGFLLIYTTLSVLLLQSFLLVGEIAEAGLEVMLAFLQALIPTYAMTMVFAGNAVTAAFAYEVVFGGIYLLELLIKNILCPMIYAFVLVLFLNHLFREDILTKLAGFMEKIVALILKASFGGIIGLGVVQSLLAPVKDRLANHVVLGAFGTAGEIILSCSMLIKNSIGMIGVLLLFLLGAIPVVKIVCFWVMYHVLAILMQPVADRRLVECVSGVARGCDLFLKIILYSMLLFLVLISMLTMATSFVH